VRTTPEARHRTRSSGEATKQRLLCAAKDLFSVYGYEGTSTRAIAVRAGVGQPLLNYHFANKDGLWRAAVGSLFDDFGELLGARIHGLRGVDDETVLKLVIRDFIVFSAAHPQLHRIMIHECAVDGERVDWLVEHHVRPIFDMTIGYIDRLIGKGVLPQLPSVHIYYIVVGAGPTLFALAPECSRLTGLDPVNADTIETHSDAVVSLLFRAHEPVRR
jgi:TetR/AcrR family transcriptional regulator